MIVSTSLCPRKFEGRVLKEAAEGCSKVADPLEKLLLLFAAVGDRTAGKAAVGETIKVEAITGWPPNR
jgi:hypothetical protein